MTAFFFHTSLPFAAIGMLAFILYTVNRNQRIFAIATLTSFAAFCCITAVLIGNIAQHGLHVTLLQGARYLLFAWVIMMIYFVAEFVYRIRLLGSILMPVALTLILVSMFDDTASPKISLQLGNVTTFAHMALVFIGLGFIFLASAGALLYLLKTNALKHRRLAAVDDRLPSLSIVKQLTETAFNCGFPALTVGIVLGIIYAGSVLESGWMMNVKIIWSCVNWLFYAILFFLHQSKQVSTTTLARGILALFLVTSASFFLSKEKALALYLTDNEPSTLTRPAAND